MKYLIISIILFFFISSNLYADRGCCSRHGGQNYCDTTIGKWVCNDGTYSPSCNCYIESNDDKDDFSSSNDSLLTKEEWNKINNHHTTIFNNDKEKIEPETNNYDLGIILISLFSVFYLLKLLYKKKK